MNKLLIGDNPSLGIRAFVESGLSLKIMPELDKLKIEVDPKHHHKDVYEHTLIVVDRVSPNIVSRLAALLHDIGKPNTKGIDNGKVHFRHHEVVGARISEQILKRLKYSKKEKYRKDRSKKNRIIEILNYNSSTGKKKTITDRYHRETFFISVYLRNIVKI